MKFLVELDSVPGLQVGQARAGLKGEHEDDRGQDREGDAGEVARPLQDASGPGPWCCTHDSGG